MTAPMAHSAAGQPQISVSNPVAVSSPIPPGETPLCEVCGKPVIGRAGKRHCSPACRLKAHRGHGSSASKEAPAKALTRDEAVTRLCHAIKSHEGLRDGLDVLCRIVEDERARLQTLPLYSRRQIARRFLDGLGLKLAETEQ